MTSYSSFCLAVVLCVGAWASTLGAVSTGDEASDFTLPSVTGSSVSLSDFAGKWVVLEWTNYSCPFVRKFYDVNKMQDLQKEYAAKGVVWLSIISSAKGKQGYLSAEEGVKALQEKSAAPTALLLDPKGTVGRAYGAKATPHMFVINPEGKIFYSGAIDSIRSAKSRDIEKADNYVAMALEAGLAGGQADPAATKAYGCGVKYGK